MDLRILMRSLLIRNLMRIYDIRIKMRMCSSDAIFSLGGAEK